VGTNISGKLINPLHQYKTARYTVTPQNIQVAKTCQGEEYNINISVSLKPKIKDKFNKGVLICYDIGDSILSYQWYKSGTGKITSNGTDQYLVTGRSPGSYWVETIDLKNCRNNSDTIPIAKKSLSVYPNPANENFAIELVDEPLGKTVISIFDKAGKNVMEIHTEKEDPYFYKNIPANELKEGVYIVRVTVNSMNVYHTDLIIVK